MALDRIPRTGYNQTSQTSFEEIAVHVKADWALQDAKAHLSQVVNRAVTDGPQRITRHGRGAAVVVSEADFQRLIARKRGSISEFLSSLSLSGIDFDVRDHHDTGREVEI
jgi:antitoxin Phd